MSLHPRRVFISAFVALLLALSAAAQTSSFQPPLPLDTGDSGLAQELRKLGTTARLLHIVAHPDDEDGAMLALQARGKGASVVLLTLTRGEGGQNETGSSLSDELGVLRSLELTASSRYYGVEQRFTRVADFGFSKSPDEVFKKWSGHDSALADIVRVIRTFRPDVVTSRFQGAARDGHGMHQAAGILTPIAVEAAADPNRFPEQIKEGLLPWRAKKVYLGARPPEPYTVSFLTSAQDPVLGMSYAKVGLTGLQQQKSQGMASVTLPDGERRSYYQRVDRLTEVNRDAKSEDDFFDGLNPSLSGLAERLASYAERIEGLRASLTEIERLVGDAGRLASGDGNAMVRSLAKGLKLTRELLQKVDTADVTPESRATLRAHLSSKQQQFERAITLAAGVGLTLTSKGGASLVPGEAVDLTLTVRNQGKSTVTLSRLQPLLPAGWQYTLPPVASVQVNPGAASVLNLRVKAPEDAAYTRPHWSRRNQMQFVNDIASGVDPNTPFPKFPIRLHADIEVEGSTVAIEELARDAQGQPVAVVPAVVVSMKVPLRYVIHRSAPVEVEVEALHQDLQGELKLRLPIRMTVKPESFPVKLATGQKQTYIFTVYQFSGEPQQVQAVLTASGKSYTDSVKTMGRDDIGYFNYYHPAEETLTQVLARAQQTVRVAYVPGAGDEIPEVLRQVFVRLDELPAEKLADTDLSKFGTIVLGIRAYDTKEDVRKNNAKLLAFVEQGGTLIVQNNADWDEFNAGKYTPYPAQLSRQRVSMEESPVTMLAPDHQMFNAPNRIAVSDFDGWVQERGVNFMSSWDERYTPLLSANDPGEEPQRGGLLIARHGKGHYIYTGYSFFRQLPAGVDGALRLYLNLLSVGHDPK